MKQIPYQSSHFQLVSAMLFLVSLFLLPSGRHVRAVMQWLSFPHVTRNQWILKTSFGSDWTGRRFPYSVWFPKRCSSFSIPVCDILSSSTLVCHDSTKVRGFICFIKVVSIYNNWFYAFAIYSHHLRFLGTHSKLVLAPCSCSLVVFLCTRCGAGVKSTMLSAKSRSSSFVANFHLMPVSLLFVIFLITKSNTNRKRKPDTTHSCLTRSSHWTFQTLLLHPQLTSDVLVHHISNEFQGTQTRLDDLSARVGESNEECENVMREHGTGTMNENGESIARFAASNNLITTGNILPRRIRHK